MVEQHGLKSETKWREGETDEMMKQNSVSFKLRKQWKMN